MFKRKGNNSSALHHSYGQVGVGGEELFAQSRRIFSAPPLRLLSSPAAQPWLSALPAHLGRQLITQRCLDVVIPFSVVLDPAVVPVPLVLVLLSYWNELVHLHTSHSSSLSVTLSVSVCTTKSKLSIQDITVWAATRWQSLDFRPAVLP